MFFVFHTGNNKPVPAGTIGTDSQGHPTVTYKNVEPGTYTPTGGAAYTPTKANTVIYVG
jgi:hypothetical protein